MEGIHLAEAVRCASVDDALAAGRRLRYPVVVKAVGAVHKSDGGGVRLGVDDDAELLEVSRELLARTRPGSLSVESQHAIADGVEMLVGTHRDPRFGPVLLIGAGGTLAEVLADTATLLAPCAESEIVDALTALRVAALLRGHRGRPQLAIDALADIATRVGGLLASAPRLQSFELNPVLVLPDGAVALDARHEGEPIDAEF